ncbi:hypothetical protein C8R44DRAFT_726333 [Mycena epipterygia]|nr:hypothetical protein C8R44DRAFT_726333 [Mycena epipterygia]
MPTATKYGYHADPRDKAFFLRTTTNRTMSSETAHPASSSLLALPTELLVEIVSYYRDPFTFVSPLVRQEHGGQEREDRVQVLRSLSQSCSSLRPIFLPMLWDRLYASAPSFKEIYTESELKTLIFSVHKIRARINAKLGTRANGIRLPRATPQRAAQSQWPPDLPSSLEHRAYPLLCFQIPSITALCVPDHLDQVFPSFPNVTTLACPSIYAGARVLAPARQHFPRLEALGGLRLSKELIEEVHKLFPTLRSISVSSTFPADSEELFPLWKRFKRLSKLSLVHEDIADLLSLEALVTGGTDILLASGSQEKKVLRMWSYDLIKGFNVYPRVVCVA